MRRLPPTGLKTRHLVAKTVRSCLPEGLPYNWDEKLRELIVGICLSRSLLLQSIAQTSPENDPAWGGRSNTMKRFVFVFFFACSVLLPQLSLDAASIANQEAEDTPEEESSLITQRDVPPEFKRAYDFLEFIKFQIEPKSALKWESVPKWDTAKLMAYVAKDGVAFAEGGRVHQRSYRQIQTQISRRKGAVFEALARLSYSYSIPYRQYSELTFAKKGENLIVNVGFAQFRLTFIPGKHGFSLAKYEALYEEYPD